MESINDLVRTFPSRGASPALVDLSGYRQFVWTYEGLHRRILSLSTYLERQGIRAGDRVLLWGPNSPEWVASYFACAGLGATLVPADARSSAELVAQFVRRAGVKLALRSRLMGQADLGVDSHWLEDVRRMLDDTDLPLAAVRDVDPDSPLEIVFTSGTTGDPKGVVLTHRNVVANLEGVRERIRLERDHGFLSLLPLSHMFEQTVGLLGPLSYGTSVSYLRTLKPTSILDALQRPGIRVVACVPRLLASFRSSIESKLGSAPDSTFQRLVGAARRWPVGLRKALFFPVHRRLGRPHFFISGGAPLDPDLERFWDGLGVTIVVGYGLTETAPILTCNTLENRRFGSVGLSLPNVELRTTDAGEVQARGVNVFQGYLDDADATAATFDGEWFRTGDLGDIDADGFLFLKGREKDLIVLSDGSNVHAEDVEQALRRQPALRDACVVGMPVDGGEVVHAVVIPDGPGSDFEAAIGAANESLEPHQRVSGWHVWPQDDFPRTTTLKVRKHEVLAALRTSDGADDARPQLVTAKGDRLRAMLAQLSGQPIEEIRADQRLHADLGLGSLDRVELVARLEQVLNVDLDETRFAAETRVGEIEELVARGGSDSTRIPFRRWVRTGPARRLRRVVRDGLLLPLLSRYYDVEVEGLENLEGIDEPVVFAANHVSHLDTTAILHALPLEWRDRLAPAAWKEYFDLGPDAGWTQRLAKRMAYDLATVAFNAFLLPQESGFRTALTHAGELLDRGFSILIYPEGARAEDGRMVPFREGVGLLAKTMQAPVVPIWVDGMYEVLPRDRNWPRAGHGVVRFGVPRRYRDGTYASIARSVEGSVRALSGALRDGVSSG